MPDLRVGTPSAPKAARGSRRATAQSPAVGCSTRSTAGGDNHPAGVPVVVVSWGALRRDAVELRVNVVTPEHGAQLSPELVVESGFSSKSCVRRGVDRQSDRGPGAKRRWLAGTSRVWCHSHRTPPADAVQREHHGRPAARFVGDHMSPTDVADHDPSPAPGVADVADLFARQHRWVEEVKEFGRERHLDVDRRRCTPELDELRRERNGRTDVSRADSCGAPLEPHLHFHRAGGPLELLASDLNRRCVHRARARRALHQRATALSQNDAFRWGAASP